MGVFQSTYKRMHYFISVLTKEMQHSKTARSRAADTKMTCRKRCVAFAGKYNKISTLKYQLNTLLSEKKSKAFTFIKQTFLEFRVKPHKLLARQVRKRESDRAIHKIRSGTGTPVTSHNDINNAWSIIQLPGTCTWDYITVCKCISVTSKGRSVHSDSQSHKLQCLFYWRQLIYLARSRDT